MDPLSIFASITAVISAIGVVISYWSDVKDEEKETLALTDEAKNLLDLFLYLRNCAEEAEKDQDHRWYRAIQELRRKRGPLDLFKEALERLATKLKPFSSAIKGVARSLRWTLDETEVTSTLNTLERLKSQISMELDGDHLKVLPFRFAFFEWYFRPSYGKNFFFFSKSKHLHIGINAILLVTDIFR